MEQKENLRGTSNAIVKNMESLRHTNDNIDDGDSSSGDEVGAENVAGK